MTEELKVSIRIKGNAKDYLEWYCDQVDMQPAQVLRAMLADKISSFLKCPHGVPTGTLSVETTDTSENTEVSPRGHLPRAHTGDTNNLSLDKSKESKDECRNFFKTFIGIIDYKKFPERVSKEIKNNWSAILESKMSAEEMAESYNHYVMESKKGSSIPSHPNSWIAGHGWENTTEEETKNEPTGNYDF